jgi:hypothetical protein
MTLNKDEVAALRSYADERGRRWKEALTLDWYNARLSACDAMPNRGSILHGLRNDRSFGPSGLEKFRFPPERTGFDEAIENASNPDHRNYSSSLARRITAEKRMCTALVKACLDRGFLVSVHDGEEWAVKKSSDKTVILAALFSTDQDEITIRTADGNKAGWFQLIYGNDGYDVVSNSSENEVCNAIWKAVLSPLSDEIEGETA